MQWKKARPKREDPAALPGRDEPSELSPFDPPADSPSPDLMFHRSGEDWVAWIEQPDGSRVQVLVEDVDGQPNPEFVPKLAGILSDLSTLEAKARISEAELAERLTSEHRLSLICETHPKAEFALGFEAGSEIAIVDFQDGEVYSWCFLEEPAGASAAR
ncbi:MAG TPA: hypothetical protein VFW40_01175 [Capsulimonadaceae bacterium]|nr:hypothetical protein [Capsulimonadaceae bacterium]